MARLTEPPERDPLADLVSRSVGARVDSVAAEDLTGDDGVERKRLRYDTADGTRTAIFERRPRGMTLEAQLLPFLARKTPHVPGVYSRGLPPPHASLGPWLLVEDAIAAPSACESDPTDVVRAVLAIERAVAHDEPALRALGVPLDDRALPGRLASMSSALVHGDLRCRNARRTARGVVILGWSMARIGCPVLDVATLARDLDAADRHEAAAAVRAAYVRESGVPRAEDLLVLADGVLADR